MNWYDYLIMNYVFEWINNKNNKFFFLLSIYGNEEQIPEKIQKTYSNILSLLLSLLPLIIENNQKWK